MASTYVELAKKAIEAYVKKDEVISAKEDLEEELKSRAGVFVSLKKRGQLRGCIGTFLPTKKNIAEEIISNAIAACARDPRFPAVEEEELSELVISVDVLSAPSPVHSVSELDPKKYGVIVRSGGFSGLLLPDLEGVDTIEEQLSIAKRKAGLLEDEPVEIFKFEVKRYY